MAFLRFSRDKRGYEHFYLVEPGTNRRGKLKPRVLYWFRSPPGVRVGREPFDEGVRRALEAQYPGISFDWRSIVDAPIPSADADKWRERRRADKAAKHAMAMAEAEEDDVADAPGADEPSDFAATSEDPGSDSAVLVAAAPTSDSDLDPARKRRRRRRGRRPDVAQAGEVGAVEQPAVEDAEFDDSAPPEGSGSGEPGD
jgi:hypothetical protein